uniref:Uncharacterized protein n=1 Tax=Amphimedon queenslandica TaxID=400682 RepID=A0A1X7STI9_AMPQE
PLSSTYNSLCFYISQ